MRGAGTARAVVDLAVFLDALPAGVRCASPVGPDEPCGVCQACDLHWLKRRARAVCDAWAADGACWTCGLPLATVSHSECRPTFREVSVIDDVPEEPRTRTVRFFPANALCETCGEHYDPGAVEEHCPMCHA